VETFLIDFLSKHWETVIKNPFLFLAVAAFGAFGSWIAVNWYYKGIISGKDAAIANKDAHIELLERRIVEFEKRDNNKPNQQGKSDDRADLDSKRLLIRKARQLATQQLPTTDFAEVLQRSQLYHRLRPYLSAKFKEAVEDPRTIIRGRESGLSGLAAMFLREIEQLEQVWGLRLK
jgi:hypothetical protein